MEKYDQNYREERRKALSGHDGKCSATGSKGHIETHHVLPKALGGPNHQSNLQPLVNHFHAYLHQVANVSAPEDFSRRKNASVALWRDPLSQEAPKHEREIRAIDSKVIPVYVHNLLTKFHGEIQSTLTIDTVVKNMETIRDLTIENIKLKAENERLRKQISDSSAQPK